MPSAKAIRSLLLAILVAVVGAISAAWFCGVVVAADLSVPLCETRRFKNVLAVFPHPDDETVNCGGTLNRFAVSGAMVTVLLLTQGERGNPGGAPDPALKEVRKAEAAQAVARLKCSRMIHQDFGDGRLTERKDEVKAYLGTVLAMTLPDLILTNDLSGLDGHPDHVACAEMLTELCRSQFREASLWYVALPARLRRLLQLAHQLSGDPALELRRALPTTRIFIGMGVIPKIRAWYAYRSQRGFITKGLGKLLPIWLAISMLQFEYFAEAN